METRIMKLVVSLIAGFICIFPAVGFANPPTSAPPEGMVHIPGGTYPMGSHKSLLELDPVDLFNTDRHALGPENPAHNVELEPYYIDMYEVTHGSYMKFVEATNAKKPRFWDDPDFNSPNQPVVGVAWKTAQSYCKWKGGRLPTEAEWEKASRGKRSINYPWGNETPDSTRLNYNEELKKTVAVGSYETGKSDYGVYDLAGNVAEWTYDWHQAEFYIFSSKANPVGPEKGQYKVIRGGNWRNDAQDVNMVYRNATIPSIRKKTLGFRCAQSAGATAPNEYPTPH